MTRSGFTRRLRHATPAVTALCALTALGAVTAAEANAATDVSVAVRPATPGTAAAPAPVALSLRTSLTATSRGGLPPTLRKLSIGLPDGFATALEGTAACPRDDLALRGPGACPANSTLGAGSASFVYVAGLVRIAASTDELTLVRGSGDQVLLYLRVTRPTTLTYVLPGTLTASAIAVDLSEVADPPSGYAVVRAFALDLARGVAAGPCPAGAWSFAARLEYTGGGAEERTTSATCDGSGGAPDVVRPRLRVTARSGGVAVGARLAISLSEPARVRVTLERRVAGVYRRVRRATFDANAGAGTIRIRRAGGRALRGGRYRVRVRAVDGAGLQSAKRTVAFTLR